MAKPITPKGDPASLDHADEVSPGDSKPHSALRCPAAHLWVWLIAAAGLFADVYTKHWAVRTIGDPGPVMAGDPNATLEPMVLIAPNYLVLSTWHNPGAIWGLWAHNTFLLVATSLVALGVLGYVFATTRANQHGSHIALGLLFAGALGNLYDRIWNDGNVIDFIVVDLGFFPCNPWPTFNIADTWLVIGVALLMISSYRTHKQLSANSNQETSQQKP